MERILFTNARIPEGDGFALRHVLIEGSTIVRIDAEPAEADARRADLAGAWLLPGFIHAHAHLMENYDGFNTDKLRRWLRSGITHIRDQGILSRHGVREAVAWRDSLRAADGLPSISVPGPYLSAPGGYGGLQPIGVATSEEAREAVRRLVDGGADHIKIPYDEGYDEATRALPMLEPATIAAICDEAHRLGRTVSTHVARAARLRTLVECGVDEAGHTCMDPIPDDLIARMVADGIAMTPTLSMYAMFTERTGLPLLDAALDNTRRFAQAGGVIGLGNDYLGEDPPWAPVGMPILEMELLLRAGLDMPAVVRAATVGGAAILGRTDLGRIVPGCRADLIALDTDPYAGPHAFAAMKLVVKDGIIQSL